LLHTFQTPTISSSSLEEINYENKKIVPLLAPILLLLIFSCNSGSSPANFSENSGEDTAAAESFSGNIVLGSPTATSIKISVFSPDKSGTVFLRYGTSPGGYDKQTATTTIAVSDPLELLLEGFTGDTRYYYRLYFQTPDTSSEPSEEYTFHTARPAESTFTFTLQSDSHLDENSDLDLYRRTLANVLADLPDFHVDLGDTFMCEKHFKSQ
jgi:hypothetical protein